MTISTDQLEQWTHLARRDDWHLTFVGSDIRQMLGEIERLRAALDDMIALCRHKASNRDEEARVEAAVAARRADEQGGQG